jgi:hypothetical protein
MIPHEVIIHSILYNTVESRAENCFYKEKGGQI